MKLLPPPLWLPFRLPPRGDIIEIETWFHEHGKIGAQRDFAIRDRASGELLGRATTTWVMIKMQVRSLLLPSCMLRQWGVRFFPTWAMIKVQVHSLPHVAVGRG